MLCQEVCLAGRGNHYIEYGGYTWKTLDGADPDGPADGAPRGGCQWTDNYLLLPAGWVLAPHNVDSLAVITAHSWSTRCPVLADGTSWNSALGYDVPGDRCGLDNYLATSTSGMYAVTTCSRRVLARCGAEPPCWELSAVGGMTIAYSNGRAVGSVATYSCTSAGHMPIGGDATRTCLDTGSWDGGAPTSCIVRCPATMESVCWQSAAR